MEGEVHSYSKYFRRPRVRTGFLLVSLPILPVVVQLVDASSGSISRDRRRRQQRIARTIIE